MKKNLSDNAQKVINNYLNMQFGSTSIPCPYFNNKKLKVRGGLRVLLGKGTPEEIKEEAELLALREKVDLKNLNEEKLKQFLVDHNLGVDCSGFVYHVLDAELHAKGKGSLKKHLSFPYAKNPLRKFLTKLRPTENVNVKTLIHEDNTTDIALQDIQPGDLIFMLGTGKNNDLDHVLLVTEVTYEKQNEMLTQKNLTYTHSLHWNTDGKYNHKVRQGEIHIIDTHKPLLKQHWLEENKTGDDNETFWRAKTAEVLKIGRLI